MSRTHLIRKLVLTEVIAVVAAAAGSVLTLSSEDELQPISGWVPDSISVVIGVALFGMYLLSWIGLWIQWTLARYTYATATGGGLLFSFLLTPYEITGFEQAFTSLAYIASGALIYILFIQNYENEKGA